MTMTEQRASIVPMSGLAGHPRSIDASAAAAAAAAVEFRRQYSLFSCPPARI